MKHHLGFGSGRLTSPTSGLGVSRSTGMLVGNVGMAQDWGCGFTTGRGYGLGARYGCGRGHGCGHSNGFGAGGGSGTGFGFGDFEKWKKQNR